MDYEIVATSTFGVEAVLKKEIKNLGFEITDSRNGRISFKGDERALVQSNMWLRTADRVYLKLSEFKAVSFEELFNKTLLNSSRSMASSASKSYSPFLSRGVSSRSTKKSSTEICNGL